MNETAQTLLVGLAVAGSLWYLARRGFARLRSKKGSCSAGCGCSAKPSPPGTPNLPPAPPGGDPAGGGDTGHR